MATVRGFLSCGALLVLLAGCVAPQDSGDGLEVVMVSTVDPSTMPAFLDEPQDADDVLPVAARMLVDPATSRYQGDYAEQSFYLATDAGGSVRIVSNAPGSEDGWGAGGSVGNVPFASGLFIDDGTFLVYLPQGSANPPDGWRVFSDWLIINR